MRLSLLRKVVYITVWETTEDEENIKLKFEIRDTGTGIPKEKLVSIFESFVQIHSDKSNVEGGTGLGLAIAKNLVIFSKHIPVDLQDKTQLIKKGNKGQIYI